MATFQAQIYFQFTGLLEIDAPNDHDARVSLAQLESSILDEIQNWPTSELNEINVTAKLLSMQPT